MTELTIANLKGGVGKTTTAVHLALGLAADGSTLLVDTDLQRSAEKWAQDSEQDWPWDRCAVVNWTDPKTLSRRIDSARPNYRHVIIDVPPSRQPGSATGSAEAAVLSAALQATGNLVVPTSTSAIDLREIADTFDVAAAVDIHRVVLASVLLIRVRAGTSSASAARAVLEEYGYPVLATVIPLRESIAQSFGTVPATLPTPYVDALTEIRDSHKEA